MQSSPYPKKLDQIQRLLDPQLKQLGFKKQRRTYNRSEEPGVVQVIWFQMGQGQGSLSGQFTVNLGIEVAELYESSLNQPMPKFLNKIGSSTREIRLGELIDGKDRWWNLETQTVEEIADQIEVVLLNKGIAFLEMFSTRTKIIDGLISYNKLKGYSTRAPLEVVIILAKIGRMQEAGEMLKKHYSVDAKKYVREVAKKLKLESYIGER